MTNSATAASAGTVAGASRSDIASLLAIELKIITPVTDAAQLAKCSHRSASSSGIERDQGEHRA